MDNKEKLKLAQIIAKHLCPEGKTHFNLYKDTANCYSRENFANCKEIADTVDELVAAGLTFDKTISILAERKDGKTLIHKAQLYDQMKYDAEVAMLAGTILQNELIKVFATGKPELDKKLSNIWALALYQAKKELQNK